MRSITAEDSDLEAAGVAPLTVYGIDISYFTGKFEAYLRYRGIPYEHRNLTMKEYLWTVKRALGGTQYPSVRLADGRWMSDTTPMIEWLDGRMGGAGVIPADPLTGFLARLIEDYGDEWLWRPAMHYRWNNAEDARLASTRLAEAILTLPVPLELRRRWIAHRQTSKFVVGDGVVDAATREYMDGAYLRLLDAIEGPLSSRPFLFGGRPTIADFGLFGSMFRHFANDPTPAAIMQERAPSAWDWVHRLWSARESSQDPGAPIGDSPVDLGPLLSEVTSTLFPQLELNARAHGEGRSHHDLEVGGVTYRQVPTSPYRVWVLEQIRDRWSALGSEDQRQVLDRLGMDEAPRLFSEPPDIESGHDPDGTAPFCSVSRMVRD